MAARKSSKPEKTVQITNIQEEKLKALEHALADLDKQFGKGSVIKMGSEAIAKDIPVIHTGCLTLDYALGVGKAGGIAAFVDAEHALDPAYAKKLGVNIDELYVSQPDTGEQALEITEALVRSGALDVVVIDSVAALVPKAEIDGEMGDSFVGLQARLMSQALRKLTGIINKTGCVAIFINQLREKVGVLYGSPETTPGGRALKFYSSVRLDVRKGEPLKNGSEVIGNRTKVKVVKNKVAPPFRIAEFDIIYGEGISTEGTLLDMAVEMDIVHKSGAFFSYNDQRLAQGRDNARKYLKEHPELTAEIEARVRERMFEQKPVTAEEAGAAAEQAAEEEDDMALLEEDLDNE